MRLYDLLIQKKIGGGGSSARLDSKSITANGTYAASADNLDGYSSVTVNVPDTAAALLGKTITTLNVPNTTTNIVDSLCYNCTELTSVVFEEPASLTTIGHGAFRGCTKLSDVSLPSTITSMKNYAFTDCKSLTSIEIPSGVIYLFAYMFMGCSNLKQVTLPQNLVEIGYYSLNTCDLVNIKIPASVTLIGVDAFWGNKHMTEIDCTELTTTNGVINTTLGNNAFYDTNNAPIIFADAATMAVYAAATNWSVYASRMTYVGA